MLYRVRVYLKILKFSLHLFPQICLTLPLVFIFSFLQLLLFLVFPLIFAGKTFHFSVLSTSSFSLSPFPLLTPHALSSPLPPQGVVPAAEPAHGRSAGLHLRSATGPQPRRRLDGPGHAVRVLQPAARRHQVLHQRHTQQGLHQHHRANPPHQMPAGEWREERKAGGAHVTRT